MSDLEHEPPLDVDEPPVEAPEAEEAPEIPPEVIEQARKYGWKAPEDWQGKPPEKGFMAPDQYLDLPQVQNKILRDEMASIRQAQEKRDRETADKLARMDRMYQEAEKRRVEQHKAEVERIKADMRKAAETGDVEQFDALSKQQEALGAVPQPKQEQADPEVEQIQAWVQNLPADHWWKQDKVLRNLSGSFYDEAGERGVMGVDAKLAYVEKRLREELPHKFGQPSAPPKQRVAKVDGGGLGSGTRRPSDKLPADAAKIGKQFVEEGLFKDLDDYAKSYFEQEGV